MQEELAKEGTLLDGEYYCFHHPEAKVDRLKGNCECRKPKPGLLLQAAKDMDIDLSQSWMIGDNITDVKAGVAAGCRTILVGRWTKRMSDPMPLPQTLRRWLNIFWNKEAKHGNLR